jgi:hypothetical protein
MSWRVGVGESSFVILFTATTEHGALQLVVVVSVTKRGGANGQGY